MWKNPEFTVRAQKSAKPPREEKSATEYSPLAEAVFMMRADVLTEGRTGSCPEQKECNFSVESLF